MQLQMTSTSCVCEDKPGYVSSVNGQTGHVVLDIPEKLSDLYQDIEYATPDFVDEKVIAEHNYTDSVKSNLEDEIGKLVTGVSSVNGMTGDVTIETADTKYIDDKFDTLNSSVNANFQVKGDYATNERVNNVEA